MARRRSFYPPTTSDAALNEFLRAVADELNATPAISRISTADGPNSSGISGDYGLLAVDVGSSATKLWQKFSASTSTTGWSAYSWI